MIRLDFAVMTDNRHSSRKRTYKGGKIYLNHAGTLDCTVRDLSPGGACLEIESPVGIPDSFSLSIRGEFEARKCHVTWRKARRIGVQFR
jgi:hypothetical protein